MFCIFFTSFKVVCTLTRDVSLNPTVIQGTSGTSHRKAVSAINLPSPTQFDGFVVQGARASDPSANSYAIYVRGSGSNLSITNNTVYAADGAAGTAESDGVDGSSAP